jgi:hypothetical protein
VNYFTAGTTESGATQTFHDLGWIQYVMPDISSTYYVHPTLRVTTDVNLHSAEALARVTHALGYTGGGTAHNPPRMDLWLRDGGRRRASGTGNKKGKRKGNRAEDGLVKWWVDHVKREVSCAEDVMGLEDRESRVSCVTIHSLNFSLDLDMEYRYWVFMESHPAHAALPFAAHREAMDVLTWAWTGALPAVCPRPSLIGSYLDRLLPPQHEEPLPSPFTQSECQELLGIMRSFGGWSFR